MESLLAQPEASKALPVNVLRTQFHARADETLVTFLGTTQRYKDAAMLAQQLAGHETRAAEYWHLASWYGPDGKTKRVIHSGEKEWALELFVLQHIPVTSPRAQDVLIKDTKHIPAFAQVCAILAEGMKKAQLIVPDLSTWSQTKSMPDGVLQTLRDQEYIAPHNKSYVDGLSLTPKGENLINAYKQRGTLQLYALIHLDS